MRCARLLPGELDWSLDFRPTVTWPDALPIIACESTGAVVAGFDRRSQTQDLNVLFVDAEPKNLLADIWLKDERLRPFSQLRLKSILGMIPDNLAYLLATSARLQDFFDSYSMALGGLKPLRFLLPQQDMLASHLERLKPSASEIRDILDLLNDLVLSRPQAMALWPDATVNDARLWIQHLRQLRQPSTTSSDQRRQALIQQVPWPRGLSAQWQRTGDQTALVIHARVRSSKDFEKVKCDFSQLSLESLWGNDS